MLGRRPRPSQTRAGQFVDNPPLEGSDTAKLKVLVHHYTQDLQHDQDEINKEVLGRLATLHGWRTYEEKRGLAHSDDIRSLWRFIIAACVVGGAAAGALFTLLMERRP